jgi:hypothetical protein
VVKRFHLFAIFIGKRGPINAFRWSAIHPASQACERERSPGKGQEY